MNIRQGQLEGLKELIDKKNREIEYLKQKIRSLKFKIESLKVELEIAQQREMERSGDRYS